MSRADVLANVRSALARRGDEKRALPSAGSSTGRNLVPKRAQVSGDNAISDFEARLEAIHGSSVRVSALADVPEAVSTYLRENNLPQRVAVAPDESVSKLAWANKTPMLEVEERGRAKIDDAVSVAPVLAGIAETGTLVFRSSATTPTTLNFLPETQIAVIKASQMVGGLEDAFDAVRSAGETPRTVNMVSGPSRTGDIEQTLYLGAHGPKRLHVIVVEDA